jgi:hypothetical protein
MTDKRKYSGAIKKQISEDTVPTLKNNGSAEIGELFISRELNALAFKTNANTVIPIISNVDPRPYKVYTALLTQSGTNAPVATVLENTLGGEVVWSRSGSGDYYGNLTNGFSGTFSSNQDQIATLDPETGNTLCQIFVLKSDNSNVRIQTMVADDQTDADNILLDKFIEIRVYNNSPA